ncbi:MAG: cadmium resistance transporter, partial [Lactobacillaceae bacterium]|nr:cadmium resistance transporter [Lactobacillaceae bacterium]
MLQQLLTATISYIGTTTDYFIILLLVFSRFKKTVQIKSIVAGAYFGNLFLVIVSLIIALFLKRIPQEYLLGLLGLIPIILGIKNYFFQNDEAGDV